MSSDSLYAHLAGKNKNLNQAQNQAAEMPDEAAAPRPLLKSMLLPDETLLRVGIVSNGIYWKSIAVLIFALVFMLVMAVVGLPANLMILFGVVLFFKVVLMFSLAALTKHYLLLVATDKRVIMRYGIINLEVIQMRYSKVESSEIASTIPGRLIGYASVFVSGTGGHTLAIPYIANAAEFRETISQILLKRDDLEVLPESAA
ncbi:MAG: PH domain-containing protein [Alphaproteobacteria bacterium]|nr:PH domain-containing protein [Alphaproteobacteria bacterium]